MYSFIFLLKDSAGKEHRMSARAGKADGSTPPVTEAVDLLCGDAERKTGCKAVAALYVPGEYTIEELDAIALPVSPWPLVDGLPAPADLQGAVLLSQAPSAACQVYLFADAL